MSNELYITTVRDGNWSRPQQYHDSPWWASDEEAQIGLVPGDDWSVIVKHILTVDVDTIVGHSLQAAIWEPLAISTTSGSAVTLLPTGNYTAAASVFSANGETQVGNTATASFLLTQGVSKPQITFATSPPLGCSYRLYLDHPAEPGHRDLYCEGIIGTTVDLLSDKWLNPWVAGVATGGVVGIGNSTSPIPSGTSSAITITADGSLTIAAGKKLLVRGDLVVESSTGSTKPYIRIGSGATFRNDSSIAVDATRAEYVLWFQGGGDLRWLG